MPELKEHIEGLKKAKNLDRAFPHLNGLREIGSSEAAEAIIEHGLGKINLSKIKFNMEQYEIWSKSISYLVKIGKPAVDPLIKQGLTHKNQKVVEGSAWALGSIRDKKALPHLMKMVGTNEETNQAVKTAVNLIQYGLRIR